MSSATVFRRILTSVWIHSLLIVIAFLMYNRFCYTHGSIAARRAFSDIAAPYYARLEGSIRNASDAEQSPKNERFRWWPARRVDPSTPLNVDGLGEFVRSLDAASVRAIARELWGRATLLITPVALGIAVVSGVVVQLVLGRQLPPWAIALLLPLLAFSVNLSVARIDDGARSVVQPFNRRALEYYGDVPRVRGRPGEFIRRYPTLISEQNYFRKLSGHARTHPPGAVLFLWAVGRFVSPGLTAACYAAIAVSALGSIPAYLLARLRGGNTAGLIAGALYLFTPGLVLFGATCMDGVFATFLITSVWLLAAATTRAAGDARPYRIRPERSGWVFAALGGVALAVAAFMTYSTAFVCLVFALYTIVQLLLNWRWGLRSLILLSLAAGVFIAFHAILYASVGYDPIACVRASLRADADVMDSIRRRWLDVGIANFVAFFVASGFVAATLWLHTTVLAIRDAVCRPVSPQRTYVLESVCLIAVLGMSFSRLYTLETERIWIFLMPIPIAAAASGLARGAQTVRTVRVVTALVLTFAQTWVVEVFVYTWW